MKVHKGDTVLVIAGKDKGAKGKVLQAYPTRNKVLVEGVNRIKKHTRDLANQRGAPVRRHRHPGGADPRLQRDGRRLRRQADPRRLPRRRETARGSASPRATARTSEMTTAETDDQPRLKQRYREEISDALNKSSATPTSCRSPAW